MRTVIMMQAVGQARVRDKWRNKPLQQWASMALRTVFLHATAPVTAPVSV